MKKKILGGIATVAIAAIAAVNVNFNNEAENGLSALSLANVEALADGESGGGCIKLCMGFYGTCSGDPSKKAPYICAEW